MVTIPEGVASEEQFPVTINGQQLMVTCPSGARPGTSLRVVPPPPTVTTENDDDTQLFEVQVPNGVKPGAPFALLAGGVRVLVTCPTNAGPGQRFRFRLSKARLEQAQQPKKYVALCHRQVDSGVDR